MVDVICPPLSISSIVVSLWLAGCLSKSTLIGWREYYGGGGVGVDRHLCGAQQTGGFDPMLFQYWHGAGPTLKQHWSSLCVCWESCPHFDTRVPSVSGWNRLHSALCIWFYLMREFYQFIVWRSAAITEPDIPYRSKFLELYIWCRRHM